MIFYLVHSCLRPGWWWEESVNTLFVKTHFCPCSDAAVNGILSPQCQNEAPFRDDASRLKISPQNCVARIPGLNFSIEISSGTLCADWGSGPVRYPEGGLQRKVRIITNLTE